jgi:hypothetical protein
MGVAISNIPIGAWLFWTILSYTCFKVSPFKNSSVTWPPSSLLILIKHFPLGSEAEEEDVGGAGAAAAAAATGAVPDLAAA